MAKQAILLMLTLVGTSVLAQEGVATPTKDELVRMIIASKSTGTAEVRHFKDPDAAGIAYMQAYQALDSRDLRILALNTAVSLARTSGSAGQNRGRCSSGQVAKAFILALQMEKDKTLLSFLADDARDLFAPPLLDSQIVDIEGVLKCQAPAATPNQQVLMLYAQLPSAKMSIISTYLPKGNEAGYYNCDAIRARHGDTHAEEALINCAKTIDRVGYMQIEHLVDALSYVPSKKMLSFLCDGLTSEGNISLASGEPYPRRQLYSMAIAKMMRDESSFPLRYDQFKGSATQTAEIGDWCKTQSR